MKTLNAAETQTVAAQPAAVATFPGEPPLQQVVEEYVAFKAELERIEGEMKKRRPLIEKGLALLPGQAIPIGTGEEALALIECESESISPEDLERAKAKLGPKKLVPFIQVVEKLDIKAARNHLGAKALEKFVTVKKSIQLRVKKLKAA